MKKKSLLFLSFSVSILLYGQVGINTEYPYSKSILHIDSRGDNESMATPTNTIDDVIIDKNGNMGIGVLDPQYRLDINSGGTFASPIPAVRINDGGELEGRVLTSDEDGVGSWKNFGTVPSAVAVFNQNNNFNPSIIQTQFISTATTITLKPGTWLLFVSMLMSPNPISGVAGTKYWVRSSFADGNVPMNNPAYSTVDFVGQNTLVAGLVDGTSLYSTISGLVKIKNDSSIPKTYTYIIGMTMWGTSGVTLRYPGQGVFLEDNITAILLED